MFVIFKNTTIILVDTPSGVRLNVLLALPVGMFGLRLFSMSSIRERVASTRPKHHFLCIVH